MRINPYLLIGYMVTLCGLTLLSPVEVQATTITRTQVMMGDVPVSISIAAPADRKAAAINATSEAFRKARRLELSLSEFHPGSQTSYLNQHAFQKATRVDDDMGAVMKKSLEISQWTDGLFDITFASKNRSISYRDISFDPQTRQVAFQQAQVKIGLSGIAKGYIVDQMAAELRRSGFNRFLINAGGDIWAEAPNNAPPWLIELFQQPTQDTGKVCQLELRNQAIATSGTYERSTHLIDPRTTRPARSDLAAVSVIAPDATTADALATAAYVAGDQLPSLLERVRKSLNDVVILTSAKDGSVRLMEEGARQRGNRGLDCRPTLRIPVDKTTAALLPASQ